MHATGRVTILEWMKNYNNQIVVWQSVKNIHKAAERSDAVVF